MNVILYIGDVGSSLVVVKKSETLFDVFVVCRVIKFTIHRVHVNIQCQFL